MNFYKCFLGGFILMFCAQLSRAQIVNIEDKKMQLDTNTLQGQLDIGSKYTQNTKTVFALSSSIRLDLQGVLNHWMLLGNYNFVRAGEESFIDNGFVHLRYSKKIKNKLRWEAFGQVQYNEKLRINFRGLLGAGPRFQLYEESKIKLAVGLLYMYEYNELDAEFGIRRNHRMSSYFTVRFKPAKNIAFSSTSYYQPILNDFKESRVSTINTLSLKFNRFLSFTSSFSLTYDAQLAKDAPNVPTTTFVWKNGMRILF